MRTIVLTGFMATGKSEIGRRLATRLGRAFLDTDTLIEQRAGKSVAAIFADDGEAAFRALERAVVADTTARAGAVLAVGGGAVLDPANAARLKAAGLLVCLTARPETILERAGDLAHRPLLTGGDPRATIARLLAERQAVYEATADVIVDTSDLSPDEAVEEIERRMASVERGDRWKSST
jgi:shikimate kinase